jgi:hypothetical protein
MRRQKSAIVQCGGDEAHDADTILAAPDLR